ncbi:Hypothetical predicted protein [Lecanosticta acicola]|uniref:Uncharacterized protein n=1 Tax=Lecanosticta acicola TaxID=111012 RepID=A0AAI8Z9L7_9PEZI|nr:Hypothetical predicted protein [Lecanosticta acicola]
MPAYRVTKQKAPRKGRKATAQSAPVLPPSTLGDDPDQEHPAEIIDENSKKYYMRWLEPDDDDKTKLKYDPEWVNKSWANQYAVDDWKQRKRAKTAAQASDGVAAEKERYDKTAGHQRPVQQTAVAADSAQEDQSNEKSTHTVENTENIVDGVAGQGAQIQQEQTASAEGTENHLADAAKDKGSAVDVMEVDAPEEEHAALAAEVSSDIVAAADSTAQQATATPDVVPAQAGQKQTASAEDKENHVVDGAKSGGSAEADM